MTKNNAAKIAQSEAQHVANTAAAYGEGSGQHEAAKAEIAARAAQRETPTITLTDAAAALIKADVAAFKKDRKRYADYVAEMEVTAETVADHVALFRQAYKAALPKAHADEIRAYATKVRNGINYWVGKALTDDSESDTDYLALVLKAAENAVKHGVSRDDIHAAVERIQAAGK